MSNSKDSRQTLDRLAGRKITVEGHLHCDECGHDDIRSITVYDIPGLWKARCPWCGKTGKVQVINDELRKLTGWE